MQIHSPPLCRLRHRVRSAQPVERTELRTETSRTFELPDGYLQTELYTGPIHFKDQAGVWRRFDNTLVASSRPGFSHENAAGPYEMLVASEPNKGIRFEHGSHWINVAPTLPPASAAVTDARAIYSGFKGAELTYTATNTGVKEALVLVVGQFDTALSSRSSSPTISSTDQTWSVTPAAMAGVVG